MTLDTTSHINIFQIKGRPPFHKRYIKKYYDNVIVALDPDALTKGIDIAHELNGKVLSLMDDLKYKLPEDLEALEEMLDAC